LKSFEFTLERVLRWRSVQLSSEQAKLKRLIEEHGVITQQLYALQTEIQEIKNSAIGMTALDGRDLASLHAYHSHAVKQEQNLVGTLASKQKEIAAQQLCFWEARKRCRLLEELRNRKFAAWRQQLDREIEQVAAESVAAAYVRAQTKDKT